MDEIEYIAEGYKGIQEWAKWLVTIEIALCTGLWPKLTATPRPPASLYLGWMLFVGSIVVTAVMLAVISFYLQRVSTHAVQDIKRVKFFVFLQSAFFFGGILCFGWRMLTFWLGA